MASGHVSHYTIQRLNTLSERSWAVIVQPKGAIALDAAGKLLMGLSKDDARGIADRLDGALGIAAGLERLAMWPQATPA